jgi:hypothetical protein
MSNPGMMVRKINPRNCLRKGMSRIIARTVETRNNTVNRR